MKGKVAVVTGAGKGIGEGYARGLSARGCRVVVADIDVSRGQQVAEALQKSGGEAMFAEVDIASEASAQALAEQVVERWGRIDYLVNNAALFGDMEFNSLLEVDLDYLRKVVDINLLGALVMTRAVVPHMPEGGAIVNQTSTAAWMHTDYYSLTKLALNGLTTILARALGHRGIRCNAIAPGPTDTEALRSKVPDDYIQGMLSQMPLPRLGTPEDLCQAVAFLLSDEASWITGHVMNVDGGQLLRV